MDEETYFEDDVETGEPGTDETEQADGADAETQPAKAPLWKRLLFGAFVTFAVLFFLAVMVYEFGGMSAPDPQLKAQYEQMVADGQAGPIPARFHIPIPGCNCHSTDPVLTMQHSTRRMSECGSCHGG